MNTRKTISVFLLALYMALQLRVYSPYADYIFNQEYIATVLCEQKDDPISVCGGSCYLVKELKEKQEESQEQQLPQRNKLNLSASHIYTISNIEFNIDSLTHTCDFKSFDIHIAKQYALDIPTPPPRFI